MVAGWDVIGRASLKRRSSSAMEMAGMPFAPDVLTAQLEAEASLIMRTR